MTAPPKDAERAGHDRARAIASLFRPRARPAAASVAAVAGGVGNGTSVGRVAGDAAVVHKAQGLGKETAVQAVVAATSNKARAHPFAGATRAMEEEERADARKVVGTDRMRVVAAPTGRRRASLSPLSPTSTTSPPMRGRVRDAHGTISPQGAQEFHQDDRDAEEEKEEEEENDDEHEEERNPRASRELNNVQRRGSSAHIASGLVGRPDSAFSAEPRSHESSHGSERDEGSMSNNRNSHSGSTSESDSGSTHGVTHLAHRGRPHMQHASSKTEGENGTDNHCADHDKVMKQKKQKYNKTISEESRGDGTRRGTIPEPGARDLVGARRFRATADAVDGNGDAAPSITDGASNRMKRAKSRTWVGSRGTEDLDQGDSVVAAEAAVGPKDGNHATSDTGSSSRGGSVGCGNDTVEGRAWSSRRASSGCGSGGSSSSGGGDGGGDGGGADGGGDGGGDDGDSRRAFESWTGNINGNERGNHAHGDDRPSRTHQVGNIFEKGIIAHDEDHNHCDAIKNGDEDLNDAKHHDLKDLKRDYDEAEDYGYRYLPRFGDGDHGLVRTSGKSGSQKTNGEQSDGEEGELDDDNGMAAGGQQAIGDITIWPGGQKVDPSNPGDDMQRTVTETIEVPRAAVGYIIGRKGESIRAIIAISGAKVDTDCGRTNDSRPGTFTVSGTSDNVRVCCMLIREKLNILGKERAESLPPATLRRQEPQPQVDGQIRLSSNSEFKQRHPDRASYRDMDADNHGIDHRAVADEPNAQHPVSVQRYKHLAVGQARRFEDLDGRDDTTGNDGEIKRDVWVPENMVGLVIGSGGSTIRTLQEKSCAYIAVVNETIEGGNKKFIVKGHRVAVERAEAMIKDVVSGTFFVGHDPGSGEPASCQDGGRPGPFKRVKYQQNLRGPGPDQTHGLPLKAAGLRRTTPVDSESKLELNTKCVYIPNVYVRILVGRKGETIRDIENRSGALIKISPDIESPNRSERLITIQGPPAVCEQAHTMLNDLVTEARERKKVASSRNSCAAKASKSPTAANDSPSDSRMPVLSRDPVHVEETISIHAERVGIFVSENNTVLKDIQARSGARISVEGKNESNGPFRSIHIVGSPHQVEHAIALILAQIESQRDNDPVGLSSRRKTGHGEQQTVSLENDHANRGDIQSGGSLQPENLVSALNASAIPEATSDTNINVPRIASIMTEEETPAGEKDRGNDIGDASAVQHKVSSLVKQIPSIPDSPQSLPPVCRRASHCSDLSLSAPPLPSTDGPVRSPRLSQAKCKKNCTANIESNVIQLAGVNSSRTRVFDSCNAGDGDGSLHVNIVESGMANVRNDKQAHENDNDEESRKIILDGRNDIADIERLHSICTPRPHSPAAIPRNATQNAPTDEIGYFLKGDLGKNKDPNQASPKTMSNGCSPAIAVASQNVDVSNHHAEMESSKPDAAGCNKEILTPRQERSGCHDVRCHRTCSESLHLPFYPPLHGNPFFVEDPFEMRAVCAPSFSFQGYPSFCCGRKARLYSDFPASHCSSQGSCRDCCDPNVRGAFACACQAESPESRSRNMSQSGVERLRGHDACGRPEATLEPERRPPQHSPLNTPLYHFHGIHPSCVSSMPYEYMSRMLPNFQFLAPSQGAGDRCTGGCTPKPCECVPACESQRLGKERPVQTSDTEPSAHRMAASASKVGVAHEVPSASEMPAGLNPENDGETGKVSSHAHHHQRACGAVCNSTERAGLCVWPRLIPVLSPYVRPPVYPGHYLDQNMPWGSHPPAVRCHAMRSMHRGTGLPTSGADRDTSNGSALPQVEVGTETEIK